MRFIILKYTHISFYNHIISQSVHPICIYIYIYTYKCKLSGNYNIILLISTYNRLCIYTCIYLYIPQCTRMCRYTISIHLYERIHLLIICLYWYVYTYGYVYILYICIYTHSTYSLTSIHITIIMIVIQQDKHTDKHHSQKCKEVNKTPNANLWATDDLSRTNVTDSVHSIYSDMCVCLDSSHYQLNDHAPLPSDVSPPPGGMVHILASIDINSQQSHVHNISSIHKHLKLE